MRRSAVWFASLPSWEAGARLPGWSLPSRGWRAARRRARAAAYRTFPLSSSSSVAIPPGSKTDMAALSNSLIISSTPVPAGTAWGGTSRKWTISVSGWQWWPTRFISASSGEYANKVLFPGRNRSQQSRAGLAGTEGAAGAGSGIPSSSRMPSSATRSSSAVASGRMNTFPSSSTAQITPRAPWWEYGHPSVSGSTKGGAAGALPASGIGQPGQP